MTIADVVLAQHKPFFFLRHWCRYSGQKSRWFERAQGRWGLLPAMPFVAWGAWGRINTGSTIQDRKPWYYMNS